MTRMFKTLTTGGALAAAIAASPLAAASTLTFYTSEAAWQAAASAAPTTFDFNSAPAADYSTAAGYTASGVNIVSSDGSGGYYLNLTPAHFCCDDYNNPNATLQAAAATSDYYGISNGVTTFTLLSGGVSAFGLTAYSVLAGDYSGAGADTLNLTAAGQTGQTTTSAGSTTGFVGFVDSGAPVTTATLTGTGHEEFIDLVDVSFAAAPAGPPPVSAPEPGGLAAAGAGLAAMAAARRRRSVAA